MNAKDRKELEKALERLPEVRLILQEVADVLERLAEEEQEKFDNLSEGLQASERGQAFERNAEALGDAHEALESAIEGIEGVESLETE